MSDEYSVEGDENLILMKNQKNFTEWMYSEIKPFIRGNVLEVGSGIGIYSEKLIRDFSDRKIVLSDIDQKYSNQLKVKFANSKNIGVYTLDLAKKSDFDKIAEPINSVIALNVLEHVKDDVSALNNVYELLPKGGWFLLLVPAHKILFNCMDSSIGHYRRYSEGELMGKISQTKFKVLKKFHFNFFSMFGWYINGTILKNPLINPNGIRILNKIVPILKSLEKHILRKKIGISLIILLEKP